jgi:hypothetical protein
MEKLANVEIRGKINVTNCHLPDCAIPTAEFQTCPFLCKLLFTARLSLKAVYLAAQAFYFLYV